MFTIAILCRESRRQAHSSTNGQCVFPSYPGLVRYQQALYGYLDIPFFRGIPLGLDHDPILAGSGPEDDSEL